MRQPIVIATLHEQAEFAYNGYAEFETGARDDVPLREDR